MWFGSPEAQHRYEERMKQIKEQLLFTDPIRWYRVNKELPNKKTRYAGRFGVTVLGFDLDEFIDSGSCNPKHLIFKFKSKQFEDLGSDGSFYPVGITHWTPLPPIPIYGLDWQKEPKTAMSPFGFRYLKGSDSLAKEFAKIPV
jgi:hypothetical protein